MKASNLTDSLGEKIVIQPASKDGYLRGGDVKMFEVLFQHLLDVYFLSLIHISEPTRPY